MQLAGEGLEQPAELPTDVPEADEADALPEQEEGVERVGIAQEALVAGAHCSILGHEIPAARERQREGHLRDGRRERRRS